VTVLAGPLQVDVGALANFIDRLSLAGNALQGHDWDSPPLDEYLGKQEAPSEDLRQHHKQRSRHPSTSLCKEELLCTSPACAKETADRDCQRIPCQTSATSLFLRWPVLVPPMQESPNATLGQSR